MSSDQNNIYGDRNYPVQPVWVLKSVIPSLLIGPIVIYLLLVFWYYFPEEKIDSIVSWSLMGGVFLLTPPFTFFGNLLWRRNFHYLLGDEYLDIKQGILNKQTRKIHYGVIQNILTTQDLWETILKISTVTIQNAAFALPYSTQEQTINPKGSNQNTITIPGLKTSDAQKIKQELLKRISSVQIEELGI